MNAPAPTANKGAEALLFQIGEAIFAVDTRKVREVVGLAEVTPVPIGLDFIYGVFNLHGDLVPIVAIHRVLSELAAPFHLGDPLIVVNWRGESVAIKADKMLEVRPYPAHKLRKAGGYTRGRFVAGDREVAILDTDRLFEYLAGALAQGLTSLEV